MGRAVILGIITIVLCLSRIAGAQEAGLDTKASDQERFVLNEVPGGFTKLDRQNGTLGFCTVEAGTMVCRLAADERAAYEDALDIMRTEIDTMKGRIALLEKQDADGAKPPIEDKNSRLPAEFDTAMEIAQEAMRRFFTVIEDLKKEYKEKLPPASKPKT